MKDFYILIYMLFAGFFILNSFVKLFHFPFQIKLWKTFGYRLWFMSVIGLLELFCAVGLLLGLVFPVFAFLAAAILAMLMIGAIYTHLIKAEQHWKTAIPAGICLVMMIIIMAINY